MSGRVSFALRFVLGVQVIGAAAALLGIASLPPARGPMMLVPLDRAAVAQLVPGAIGGGARLIAAGPLPASLVVAGDLDRLAAPMRRAHVLILAAPPVGCTPSRQKTATT